MALTQRFGFTYFGRGADGSFHSNGQKYTSADRRLMDRLFAALETHDHGGGSQLANPPLSGATAVLETGSGSLPAGVTLHYRYSLVDQYGLETAASPEITVTTPAPIATPGPPRVEAEAGGSLSPGVHWYALTSHSGAGETTISIPQVINVTNWNTVRVEIDELPAGSDAVSVWRQGPFDSGFTRLVTVPVADPATPPAPLFTDDGSIPSEECPCDPANLPPQFNDTGTQSSVRFTAPESVIEDEKVLRWRLYRSSQSGVFPESSLVAEVVETQDELGGPLVFEFLDDGSALSAGMPLDVSQTLTPSRPVAAGDSPLRLVGGGVPNAFGDLVFSYGVDADGVPYFQDLGLDPNGAPFGEAALLMLDMTTGALHLEELP